MSYVSQGIAFLIVGIVLLIFPIAGIIIIILSVMQISRGQQQIVPGTKPEWCKWNGHDWRKDLPGLVGTKVCRNCLKGANINYGYPVGGVAYAPVPVGPPPGTAYAPAPYDGAPPPPTYPPSPSLVPAPPQYASYAQPSTSAYCKECGLAVQATDALCPHCGRVPR